MVVIAIMSSAGWAGCASPRSLELYSTNGLDVLGDHPMISRITLDVIRRITPRARSRRIQGKFDDPGAGTSLALVSPQQDTKRDTAASAEPFRRAR
ncbi:MAG: hypothetical protein ABI134_23835 [Byssovorax sp.]